MNLYQINNEVKRLIEDSVDAETGEIAEEAFEKLNALELSKQEVINNTALTYKEIDNFRTAIKNEIARLKDIDRSVSRKQELIRRYLSQNIGEGEKIQTENYTITWRKSAKIVQDDNLISLEELKKRNNDSVREKVVLELDKKYLTELAKAGKPLPEGVQYVKINNIKIS